MPLVNSPRYIYDLGEQFIWGGWALSHEKVELMDVPRHTGERVVQEAAMLIYGWIVAGVVVGCVLLLDSD